MYLRMTCLVKRNRHDTVGGVKGLLDAIAVMDVYVDVNDTLVIFKKFENGDDDIIDVAETRRLGLFGVMKSSGPVDGDVGLLFVQFHSPGDGTSRRDLAELVQSIENRTILTHVEAL